MKCPSCGSASVKKSSAIFEQGQSHTVRRSGGFWTSSSGRVGAWSSQGSSARISGAANRNAPPIGAGAVAVFAALLLMAICVIVGISSGASFGGTLVVALCTFVGVLIVGFNLTSEARASERDNYSRQWYCSRCGSIFHEPKGGFPPDQPTRPDPDRRNDGDRPPPGPQTRHADVGVKGAPTRRAYAERIVNPVQRAKLETDRDSRGLLMIADRSDAAGSFQPERPQPLDLGLLSRLSSLGYLKWESTGDEFGITERGLARICQLR